MARNTKATVQQYRGTTAQHANYSGALGEITVDTTKKTAVVQDGVTKGGFPLAKESVKIKAGEAIEVTGGDLSGDNTIAVKIGSTAQRGVLQVGDNLEVSDGVVSSLRWTDTVDELTAANSEAISDDMHDTGLLYVKGENATVVGRAIGELAWSLLPIRCAGFHLLDGSLIYSDGIYAAFYNYMVQLKNTGEYDNVFITETEWQNSVTNYGVCGKFVLNTTNGTVRLPKVTGHVEGTIDKAALGELVEAGLPNVTGTANGGLAEAASFTGAFAYKSQAGAYSGSTAALSHFTLDASLSSPIYGNSETVQTQSIKGFLYIIVGTYSKTELQVNIDNVTAELQRKTDAAAAAHAAMPSSVYLDLELPASGGTITAPADGWIHLNKASGNTDEYAALQNGIGGMNVIGGVPPIGVMLQYPVKKGDVITVIYTLTGVTHSFRFIYANGSAPSA